MRKAVYAGSFDPITNGHLWMIEQSSNLFDKITVAIGINPNKKYTFNLDLRLEMLQRATQHIDNVQVTTFESQYLVDYAKSIDAQWLIRGLRSMDDFEYEKSMRYFNQDLNPLIQTIFLMPPRDLVEVSSSFVKGLVGPTGWESAIKKYVPLSIYNVFYPAMKG